MTLNLTGDDWKVRGANVFSVNCTVCAFLWIERHVAEDTRVMLGGGPNVGFEITAQRGYMGFLYSTV
ncbi:hypothetical protein ABKN59_011115 [Abortiporus biennis]